MGIKWCRTSRERVRQKKRGRNGWEREEETVTQFLGVESKSMDVLEIVS